MTASTWHPASEPLVVLGPDDHHRAGAAREALEAVRRRFPDGEQLVTLPGAEDLAGRDVLIVQTTAPPQDERLVSLLQLVGIVRDGGAADVTCFVPYLCYQRQDRRTRPGEPVSGRIVLDMLAASGVDSILTVDAHNPAFGGPTNIPVTDLGTAEAVDAHLRVHGPYPEVVVSPDQGGAGRAAAVADLLNVPLTVLDKRKTSATGHTWYEHIPPALSGRHCLVVDDLCSSGSTLIPLCTALATGGARCTIFITHLLTGRSALLSRLPAATEVISTDSCGDPSAQVAVLPLALEAWRQPAAAAARRLRGRQRSAARHGR